MGTDAATQLVRELVHGRYAADVLLVNARSADLARVAQAFGDGARFLVVASSMPEGLTSAYTDIKRLQRIAGDRPLEVLVSRARGDGAARNVFDKLAAVAWRFAGADLSYAGHLPAAALRDAHSGAGGGAQWVLERLVDACHERVAAAPEREYVPRAARGPAVMGSGY
ncbi:MAG: hypothetical protein M5U08_04330 [Burkholderiales bacterium]|nr:hypothetical protein [Burkholderiales bacterium]